MDIHQVYSYYDLNSRPPSTGFKYCPHCQSALQPQKLGGRDRPACPQCGFVQYRNPAPVVVFLIVAGNKILLGKRADEPGKGKWAIPSGHIEFEDDFLSTAIREAQEETNLEVEITGILNVISTFYSPNFHYLSIYVTARPVGGSPSPADDLAEVAWFSIGGPLPELAFREDIETLALIAQNGIETLRVDARFANAGGR